MEEVAGPNFVRDAVLELADYGWFVRHRRWELVARVLDVLADTLGAVYRIPVTSWGASSSRPPSGALFSDLVRPH